MKKKTKCEDCGKRRKLKRIRLLNNFNDAEKAGRGIKVKGFYCYVCAECEQNIPEP